ncbi:MAG TPA: hypothetical protein VGD60_08620 [Candidatus Acidoferrales bacterium]
MLGTRNLPVWLDRNAVIAASVAAGVLFAVSYAADSVLYFLNIPAAATIVNNVAIALFTAAVVLIFLHRHHQIDVTERAKERAIIIAEMNHHIRNAMTPLILGVSSDDITERLRTLDQATDRVDHVLTELLPTSGSTTKPRYFPSAR